MPNFTKDNIEALYYILPIANLESVLEHGLLSHRRAQKLEGHVDVSDDAVQSRRAHKKIPRVIEGKQDISLHRCVNFYINPHNAMMARRREQHKNLCVLRIHKAILSRGDAVCSTMNAAKSKADFIPVDDVRLSPRTHASLTCDDSFGPVVWKAGKPTPVYDGEEEVKPRRQAEVLFPYHVSTMAIVEIMVSTLESVTPISEILEQHDRTEIIITLDPDLFFQGARGKFSHWQLKHYPEAILPDDALAIPDSDTSESEDERHDSEFGYS